MTTFLLSLALLLFPHLVASPVREEPPKKCTGQTPCPACSTCSRCRHCKVEGGTCGACQHPDNMVVRVIDGDTIVVQVNGHPETVRLIGVDTPETKDPRKPVEYFGKEASRFTASLVKGQQVRLEIQTSPTSRDKYGRLLAYVFRESDDLLVNKEIIRQGYGHAYTKYPFDPARMEEFRSAEREAREKQRGLWGTSGGISPANPLRR